MTPAARVQAAIEVLDDMRTGVAAEQALTRWARRSRFAGSKDRAAVRDHVFDVLRRRRAAAAYGGDDTGRALMLGLLRLDDVALSEVFTGQGHAPAALAAGELPPDPELSQGAAWNLPDWLMPEFARALGPDAEDVVLALQSRAPVSLRVNTRRIARDAARDLLAGEEIDTRPNPLASAALTVMSGARKLRNSHVYTDGLVELQDAASQAVVADLPPGGRVLDYCAGGGGKSLALAMDATREVFAHDADPGRMKDLAPRAVRARTPVREVTGGDLDGLAPFDLVLCDAPCSGSGSWRRAPEGKWTLTPERLAELNAVQDEILRRAATLVGPAGRLVYVTCSVLACENDDRIAAFLTDHPEWRLTHRRRFLPDTHGDGFFAAHLTQE
ncbi:RsmB/NOP family class I SAM-dependent RNA methyltransferase [Sulfitobacter sp. D35]|uniref:RsmB/NOP family class I SAM-dependent RNA methyltransferase n=1 Tax=Sulfitobacter sp. D35 TaxID=3083252 RepID=UPI00296FE670|nr:RsmB/NOP family class I SAM-dependent RNA methyltransferase [Sulfitobacter sp. D35]MDW4497834.1 RsmB/NOP family class I SAM-dependent RNA methyltransferase [Sulfitobacter sp. D35]